MLILGSSIESDLSEEELSDSEAIIGKRRGGDDLNDSDSDRGDGDDSESDINSDDEFFLSDSEVRNII